MMNLKLLPVPYEFKHGRNRKKSVTTDFLSVPQFLYCCFLACFEFLAARCSPWRDTPFPIFCFEYYHNSLTNLGSTLRSSLAGGRNARTRGVRSTVTASGAVVSSPCRWGGGVRRLCAHRCHRRPLTSALRLVESESCSLNRLLGGRAAADGGTARRAMHAARAPARVFAGCACL